MGYEHYKILHIVGLCLLAISAGASAASGKDSPSKLPMILHGVGLMLLLVAGFGLLAKLNMSAPDQWPNWVLAKLGVWVLAAALPTMLRRGLLPRAFGWVFALALMSFAIWLGVAKAL